MALTKITSDIVESNIQQSGFKNKIIGGDFSTNPWQRGTTFAAVVSGAYTADRWVYNAIGTGLVTILKGADSPSIEAAGILSSHCLQANVTTADTEIGSGDIYSIVQIIEGLNSAPFGFGKGGTRFVTLSFWHKHTKPGINCVVFRNSDNTRSYVAEYNQNVSNTWEKAVITVPVDTTGTWLYDIGAGLKVVFTMAVGSTSQTTAGSWVSGLFSGSSNQVNNLDSTSNNFKIALVQLEFGSNDSMFESRSVGQELGLCQRYFETSYDSGVAPGSILANLNGSISNVGLTNTNFYSLGGFRFTQKKRTIPTLVGYNPITGVAGFFRNETNSENGASIVFSQIGEAGVFRTSSGNTGLAAGSVYSFHYTASAEL